MPRRHFRLATADAVVERGFEEIRIELGIPTGFPPEVAREAQTVEPRLPQRELTEIPFVTIDPPGARDLDQALHLERRGDGYRVRYAIADLAAFVSPGGLLDGEARERGLTMYAPDGRIPLYPTPLSEGAASLLPDEDRPALVWDFELDESAEIEAVEVGRALVRSRAQLDYQGVQQQLDSGTAPTSLRLLAEVGRLRQIIEKDRGAVSLPIPEQHVVRDDGGWMLAYEAPFPVEGWNAQISLLTGMAAARLMIQAGVGVLRTLPPVRSSELSRLRRVAKALEVGWPEAVTYPELIASLDPGLPAHAALFSEATTLFRGAGYQALGNGAEPPGHSALATHYAHATAPLRRLVDRFVGETCIAVCSGQEVPDWVRDALPSLPPIMARADGLARAYEAACINLVEAVVLSHRVGEVFSGVIVEIDDDRPRGEVQLAHPAVHARIAGQDLDLGEQVLVRLVEASVAERRVLFEQA